MKSNKQKRINEFQSIKDCKQSLRGGKFYSIDGRAACPKCMGVGSDDDEDDSE